MAYYRNQYSVFVHRLWKPYTLYNLRNYINRLPTGAIPEP